MDRVAAFPGLAGRIVVVTGAAAGQGLAESLLLAANGAEVVATDVRPEPPQALVDAGVEYRRLDVADEDDWAALAADLADRSAPVRGLINNAGITHRAGISAIAREDWERVLSVNLTGALLGIRALTPLMAEGSSIVNIGSSAAVTGHAPVAYSTSKWALRGLTHVAATEYGPRGIRVNIVHPGFIETEMTANAPAAMRVAQLELTPAERAGSVDEVASVVLFLLSDAAAYVNGAEVPIDGGFSSSGGAKHLADRVAAAQQPSR
jgi:3alpha(or 20beta)-hydroxysteroid dehydrogenase